MLSKLKTNTEIYGWKVNKAISSRFMAKKDNITILFDASLKGKSDGLYFHIKSVYDENVNRVYTADRYIRKYIPTFREIAFELELYNVLWNYDEQRPCARTDIEFKEQT